jgi:DNA-binding response OmpR family regulator
MSQSESPFSKDRAKAPPPAIREIRGTLFLLAIVSDEDDAATLRADLKRSRLNEYKLQRCTSIEDARNMLRACGFDLLFLDCDAIEQPESEIDRLRIAGFDNPILGLSSRRNLNNPEFVRPSGIDEFLCKEDLSPSLVEQAIRSTIARHTLASERSILESRLNLSLETGLMGSWTYYPKQDKFVLDSIALAMLRFPPSPAERSLDEIVEQVFPEDRSAVSESLDRFPLKNDNVSCRFRVDGDEMPLLGLELRGKIWRGNAFDETAIIGVIRETPKTNELYERLAEANTAIQEAFQAREEALRKADQKLQALADEIAHSGGPPITSQPKTTISTQVTETPEKQASEPAPTTAAKKSDDSPKPKKAKSKKLAKSTSDTSKQDESLSIDKKAAYQEVLKSVARKKAAAPKQESLPFDFAQEPVADFNPPNPAKEGFIGAAKRMVAMTRKEHSIDVSISIADQQSIELEQKKDLLFEILRELITNVVNHSKAKLCIITLFRDEDEWVLQVEDDGVGLDEKLKSVNAPLNKIGLFQIRTQLALKGGHLDMVPASPNGLIARVRIPVSIRDGAKSN